MRKTVSSPGSCRTSQLPLFSQTYPLALQLHHTQHSCTGWWWWWSCVCFAEEEQLSWRAAGPSCPDHSGQHCENAVTTKKSDLPSPHSPTSNPITQNQRQGPLGVLLQCASPPLSRESRSCGRAAYSREIVHFVRPKSAQSFLLQLECGGCGSHTGPDRTGSAADGRADSMALRWGSLKLACCCLLRITNMLTSRPSIQHRRLMQKNLQKRDVTGRCDSQQS